MAFGAGYSHWEIQRDPSGLSVHVDVHVRGDKNLSSLNRAANPLRLAVRFNNDNKRVKKILIVISFLGVIIVAVIAYIIIRKRMEARDFDTTLKDHNGDPINDDDDGDDVDDAQAPETEPVYGDDLTYDDYHTWEELLQEVGVIDIRDGMIEYETGNNSRLFVMLAEMGQSNPYLKTDEELALNNQIMEVFYNSLILPLKMSSQSQRVEMTDFLNTLKDHSQYLKGATPEMKDYAARVIDDTLQYQRATDRFENKCYLQFQAIVTPDEVAADTPAKLEEQIHQKAMEKLIRQITRADGLLKRADHSLSPLGTFGLLEVLYRTFNRDSSVRIRLEDIVKRQRFTLFTSAHQNDVNFKKVKQRIQIEADAINAAREALTQQYEAKDADQENTTDSDDTDINLADLEKLD